MSDIVEVFVTFLRVAVVAFGGGLAILPEMERLVVNEHHWVTHQQFVDAFALSQVTPGPGMLMVVVIGYKAAGLPGALAAATAMFLPPALLTWFIAERWGRLANRPFMLVLRRTLAPVALGLLASGCYTLFRIGVDGAAQWAIAVTAFGAVAVIGRPPWQVVAGGAVIGVAFLR
jgi:chromate transporter